MAIEFTNGYVGFAGRFFEEAAGESLDKLVATAAQWNGITTDEVIKRLEEGKEVRWCKSPNHYYDHSYGVVRKKKGLPPSPPMILCDCGHRVPKGTVMSTSSGTSCPDCYDDMSL